MKQDARILATGFNAEQNELYSQSLGYCGAFDITNDKNKQDENLAVIKMIIDMENIDYFSKLDKIYTLLCTNIGFKAYLQRVLS